MFFPTENCCAFCVEVEEKHAGHEIVGTKPFCRDHSQALVDKQLESLKSSIFSTELSLKQVSEEIKRTEEIYNRFREVLDNFEHKNGALDAVKGELWDDFYGIYSRAAEALKAAQLRSGNDGEEALSVARELCEYASKLSVSIVDARAQVRISIGLSVKDFEKSSEDEKAVIVYFGWDAFVVPKALSTAGKPSVSYLVQVFDSEKSAWAELPAKNFPGYELKNFDLEKSYKFRMLVKVKFADDPKTYTIFTEECEHKFVVAQASPNTPEKVSVTEYSIKPPENPSVATTNNLGKEYEDISNMSFESLVYKGKLREGSNYMVIGNGMRYVKSSFDGWNGCCLGSEPISNKNITRWYVRIVKSSGNRALLGVITGDYKSNSESSMWAISLHNSRAVTGSPSTIISGKALNEKIELNKQQSFCFEVNPCQRSLFVSFEKDFENFYVVADNLPEDREIYPLVMGFSKNDAFELMSGPPETDYSRLDDDTDTLKKYIMREYNYYNEEEGEDEGDEYDEEEEGEEEYDEDEEGEEEYDEDEEEEEDPEFEAGQMDMHQLRRRTRMISSVLGDVLRNSGSSSSLFSDSVGQEGSDIPQERNWNDGNADGNNGNNNDGISCKVQ